MAAAAATIAAAAAANRVASASMSLVIGQRCLPFWSAPISAPWLLPASPRCGGGLRRVCVHSPRRNIASTALAAAKRGGASSSQAPASPTGGLRLQDLKVGQTVEGTVVQWFFPGGVTVDIGAEAEGFLEVEEFRDGFPTGTIPEMYPRGTVITARVLDLEDYTIAEAAKFHLTMRSGDISRPPRYIAEGVADVTPFETVPKEQWFDGEVTLMSTWAVFVKVITPSTGKPFVGIVYEQDFVDGFKDQPIRGGSARVRVKEVDLENRRLLLTMREPGEEAQLDERGFPIGEGGPFDGDGGEEEA